MSDQTPSGNRWEPATPTEPDVPERPGRWRPVLARPGGQARLAAGVSALVVLVGVGGFLTGRASVDDPTPTEVGQQWRHGDLDSDGGDGRELPDRPFGGAPDGAPEVAPGAGSESTAPDTVPGTNS